MNLVQIAMETITVVEEGRYRAPGGAVVEIGEQVRRSVDGTVLYAPEACAALTGEASAAAAGAACAIEVTGETTGAAGGRLAAEGHHPLLLNFASALEPGGGFLRGARAQEEDLCRASSLHRALEPQRRYYQENRRLGSALYTDHLIYTPAVVFFRDERLALLDQPFLASVITSPAPCAIQLLHDAPSPATHDAIRATLERRAMHVLLVARRHGHRQLVLGAWGCGAFGNDPVVVSDILHRALADARVAGAFDRVVFAVYDPRPEQPNLTRFRARFG